MVIIDKFIRVFNLLPNIHAMVYNHLVATRAPNSKNRHSTLHHKEATLHMVSPETWSWYWCSSGEEVHSTYVTSIYKNDRILSLKADIYDALVTNLQRNTDLAH